MMSLQSLLHCALSAASESGVSRSRNSKGADPVITSRSAGCANEPCRSEGHVSWNASALLSSSESLRSIDTHGDRDCYALATRYSAYILPEEQPGGCREHSQTHSVKGIQLDDQNLQEQSTRLCVVGVDVEVRCAMGGTASSSSSSAPCPDRAKRSPRCNARPRRTPRQPTSGPRTLSTGNDSTLTAHSLTTYINNIFI